MTEKKDTLHNIQSLPLPRPFLSIPKLTNNQIFYFASPKKVKITEFYTLSDGKKRVYTENDGLKEYGKQRIISPSELSYMNLFINGILQPKLNYKVEAGELRIQTDDIPIKGTPVILQMVKV